MKTPLRPSYRVRFPERLRRNFRTAAVKAFPLEECAILLGRQGEDGVIDLQEIYYPPSRVAQATPDSINVSLEWFSEAEKYFAGRGLRQFGYIHSHPYEAEDHENPTAEPSEQDWRSGAWLMAQTGRPNFLMGIMTVYKSAKKYRTKCTLWPTQPPITKVK